LVNFLGGGKGEGIEDSSMVMIVEQQTIKDGRIVMIVERTIEDCRPFVILGGRVSVIAVE